MHTLVLYSLIILILIRLVGLFASIDFLLKTKDLKFVYQTLGWTTYVFAALFPLFSDNIPDVLLSNYFLLLNSVFASVGSFFLLIGLVSYFLEVPIKTIIITLFIIIFIPLLFYFFINEQIAQIFALFVHNLCLFFAIIAPLLKFKSFKTNIGSIRWYYGLLLSIVIYVPCSLIILSQGYRYGLYDVTNEVMIILNYIPAILTQFVYIVFLIQVEYNNSSILNYRLKDKYSHNLANLVQSILTSIELVEESDHLSSEVTQILQTSKKSCFDASELITEIRKLRK
ncbi:MAG: hypothetical protein ACFFC7_09600 [Candidatus Hermodarchaeota archaeon]